MRGLGAPQDLYMQSDGSYALGCPRDISLGCSPPISLGCACSDVSLGSFGKQINWDTQPVINTYPYNRDGYWDCQDWMTWYSKVEAKYGMKRANEVFLIWWNKQGTFAYGQDCYLLNKSFRDFWKAKGLPSEVWLDYVTKPIDLVTSTQNTIVNTTEKVIDSSGKVITNAADTAAKTSSVAKWLIPGAIVFVVGGAGYFIYKNYLKGDKKVKIGPAQLGKLSKRKKTKH